MTATTTTAPVTIAGVTREVEISYTPQPAGENMRENTYVGGAVAQIGRGAARYPAPLFLWHVTAEFPAPRGVKTTTAADGSVWAYGPDTNVRNRQARIVGWESEVARTNDADQTRR